MILHSIISSNICYCCHFQEFQRDIVKAAEAFTSIGLRHIEAGTYECLFCSTYH